MKDKIVISSTKLFGLSAAGLFGRIQRVPHGESQAKGGAERAGWRLRQGRSRL